MTAPGYSHLPDFSKGEDVGHSGGERFEPLFGPPGEQQIWVDETKVQPVEADDDLSLLASEMDQLLAIDEPKANIAEPKVDATEPGDQPMQELQELQSQHALELEQLMVRHNEEVVQRLDQLQDKLIGDVAFRLEHQLAKALQALMQERLSSESIEQLASEITQRIRRDSVERIKLCGPESLTSAVSKALVGREMCQIEVEQQETEDVVVYLDEQILSTRIADWMRKIEQALV